MLRLRSLLPASPASGRGGGGEPPTGSTHSSSHWPIHLFSVINLALLVPWAFVVIVTIMGGPMAMVLSVGAVLMVCIPSAYIALLAGAPRLARLLSVTPLSFLSMSMLVVLGVTIMGG